MFWLILFAVKFVAFPQSTNALLANAPKTGMPVVEASGSLGLYYEGKCHKTFPNYTMMNDNRHDWCSNIAYTNEEKPWIQYSFPHKAMKLTSYAVRNGCCYYYDCCCDETGEIIDYYCCCELYGFSLQGSNDNKTWKVLHQLDGSQTRIRYCEFKTYDLQTNEAFNFIRFKFEKERPGCPKCIQINQIELYGELISSSFSNQFDEDDNDESVSIIGKIKQSE